MIEALFSALGILLALGLAIMVLGIIIDLIKDNKLLSDDGAKGAFFGTIVVLLFIGWLTDNMGLFFGILFYYLVTVIVVFGTIWILGTIYMKYK